MPDKTEALARSRKALQHRGPDSDGVWFDESAELALAHVRLAILDLSEAGRQPMVSACGRYVLVLNGEIYNHLALRELLGVQGQAPDWRGHSDTETILAAMAAWGVEAALKSMVGMYALALWDREQRTLTLARDRMGEKPLYFGYVGAAFAFASELKGLRDMPGYDAELDRRALGLLMRHNYIPAPYSIYKSMGKLMPGTWLTLTDSDIQARRVPAANSYWSATEVALDGRAQPLSFKRDEEAVEALENVLSTAIRGQMMADVPLGAFLSGGVDSSLIVALMQAQCADRVNTFSIGFDEPRFNEAEYAQAVATHLGTRHTELYVTAQDALNLVPALTDIYDEPFADSSQLPTILLMRLARNHVTVSLSGDGGDELFGGYSRYFRALRWRERLGSVPTGLRGPAGRAASGLSRWFSSDADSASLAKLGRALNASSNGAFYQQFVSYWSDPGQVVQGAVLPPTVFDETVPLDLADHMMLLDTLSYLPDDILVKVDRAAMAASLETRVPLLDHRVFGFAQRLPLQYKIRGDQGKWLLRQLLYKHVPAQLIDRPKKGFGVPLGEWLRGPLKEWAEDLLGETALRRDGVFHAEPVRRKWAAHQSGKADWSAHLWGVLMTQSWLMRERGRA
jgi:asparagine synthase (glutamine-hydrolysing)